PALADTGGSAGPGAAESVGFVPRYTYVSSGYMVVEGNGGDLTVFRHSGLGAPSASPTPTPTPTPVPSVPTGTEIIDSVDSRITFDGWWPTTTNASMFGGSERDGEFGGGAVTIPFV